MHCVNPWDLNLPTTSLKSFLWNWKTYVLKMPTSSACPIHAAVMRCCFWFSVRMPNTCSSDALLLLIQCMLPTRQCTRDHGGLPMQCVAPCRQGTRGCLRRVLGATHKGLRIRGYAQGTTHKGLRTRGYVRGAVHEGYKGLRTRGYAQGAMHHSNYCSHHHIDYFTHHLCDAPLLDIVTHLFWIHHLCDALLHKLLYTFFYNSTLVWCTGAMIAIHTCLGYTICGTHRCINYCTPFVITQHLCDAPVHDATHTCLGYTICVTHRCMNYCTLFF